MNKATNPNLSNGKYQFICTQDYIDIDPLYLHELKISFSRREGGSMNNQFIQRVIFNWDKIDNNSYLKKIEAFKGIERLDFNKPVTFFVGENGSGKSTLLEALAVAYGFNPEGGTKNYVFSTHDTHSELYDAITISRGYRKEKWGYLFP